MEHGAPKKKMRLANERDVPSPRPSEALRDFCEWSRAHGMFGLDLMEFRQDSESGWGVYALHDLPPESRVASLPHRLVVTPVNILAFSQLGRILAQQFTEIDILNEGEPIAHFRSRLVQLSVEKAKQQLQLESDQLLILFLLFYRRTSSSSSSSLADLSSADLSSLSSDDSTLNLKSEKDEIDWRPYVRLLPSDFETPLYWSSFEIDRYLGGTTMHGAVEVLREELRQQSESLRLKLQPSMLFDWKETDYRWAFSVLRSRCFPLMPPPPVASSQLAAAEAEQLDRVRIQLHSRFQMSFGQSEPSNDLNLYVPFRRTKCLLPFLDLFNHRPLSKMTWLSTPSSLNFVGGSPVKAQTEIFNNYGAKSNEELLFAYGFVSNEPVMSQLDTVRLQLKVGAAVAAEAETVRTDPALDVQVRHGDTEILKGVLETLRTVCLDSNVIALDLAQAKQDQLTHFTLMTMLYHKRVALLSSSSSSSSLSGGDEEQGFSSFDSRATMAQRYRQGQIQVLDWCFEWTQQQLDALLMTNHPTDLGVVVPDSDHQDKASERWVLTKDYEHDDIIWSLEIPDILSDQDPNQDPNPVLLQSVEDVELQRLQQEPEEALAVQVVQRWGDRLLRHAPLSADVYTDDDVEDANVFYMELQNTQTQPHVSVESCLFALRLIQRYMFELENGDIGVFLPQAPYYYTGRNDSDTCREVVHAYWTVVGRRIELRAACDLKEGTILQAPIPNGLQPLAVDPKQKALQILSQRLSLLTNERCR